MALLWDRRDLRDHRLRGRVRDAGARDRADDDGGSARVAPELALRAGAGGRAARLAPVPGRPSTIASMALPPVGDRRLHAPRDPRVHPLAEPARDAGTVPARQSDRGRVARAARERLPDGGRDRFARRGARSLDLTGAQVQEVVRGRAPADPLAGVRRSCGARPDDRQLRVGELRRPEQRVVLPLLPRARDRDPGRHGDRDLETPACTRSTS